MAIGDQNAMNAGPDLEEFALTSIEQPYNLPPEPEIEDTNNALQSYWTLKPSQEETGVQRGIDQRGIGQRGIVQGNLVQRGIVQSQLQEGTLSELGATGGAMAPTDGGEGAYDRQQTEVHTHPDRNQCPTSTSNADSGFTSAQSPRSYPSDIDVAERKGDQS